VTANGLCHVGSGLTLPFLLVYLHVARGIGLGTVGLVLGTIGLAGLLCTPLVGWLADTLGPGIALVAALLTASAGTGCFALATDPVLAFTAAAIFGAGAASMWSALFSLLAEIVPPDRHVRVFSFNNAAANIGIGAGAAIGGLMLGNRSPRPYQLMFVIDMIAFALFAVVLVLTGEAVRARPRPGASPPAQTGQPASTRANWRTVLADRRLLLVTGLNALLIAAVSSQLTAAFPAWAIGPAQSSAGVIGLAFFVNTFLVVALQPVLIGRIENVARTTAAAAAALLFAGGWLVILIAPLGRGGSLTSLTLIAGLVLAAFGEIFLAPSLSALVNGLATGPMRGRYNAFFNIGWQVGPIVGPVVAGLMIGHGMAGPLIAGLAGACLLAAAYAGALRRIMPAEANGIASSSRAAYKTGQPTVG